YPEQAEKTKIEVNTDDITPSASVVSSDPKIFAEDEMKDEISRCLRCQCDACRKHCDLTTYFDKWPLQMRDDIMTTTMPANSMIRKAPAIRLINMCTQCGLCGETCPGQIELGGMIKEARRMMHKIDRMPGAYHQFWVRDMEFANGKYAALAKCPPGKDTCSFAFFPGCHLGAADPEYVKGAYSSLLCANEDVGILLRCCSVPADWAGNEEVHGAALESLKADWEALGRPTMIMACPSCMKHFREYLPEIPIISLYEIYDQWEIPVPCSPSENPDAVWSVFDPCSARNSGEMQDAVRKLMTAAGMILEDLPGGDKHGCCGFGGNIEVASPKMAAKVTSDRSALSDNPYITYCINCRDVFHDDGKPAKHILDILLGLEGPGDELPTVTERRCNRVILKEKLLSEIWSETMNEKPILKYDLIIGPEMKAKMDALKILEEDICHVIEMGELHGRKTYDPNSGTYKCYREIGKITCWTEYKPTGDAFEIINVYTHRMKIELEVVFNGRKTDFDLR
ncbi:MAG: heterodisulfide reductase-related iron-sulfur binding cluster, partial [Bacillota bacterium]|nr:heterodisulfide reductase-related iron-sulfur binding cluster [Bacillota bacterium]